MTVRRVAPLLLVLAVLFALLASGLRAYWGPPDASLSQAGRSVTGEPGPYCWRGPTGNGCAEAATLGSGTSEEEAVSESEALTVLGGSAMLFSHDGKDASIRVGGARAYPIAGGGEPDAESGWPEPLPVSRDGRRTAIGADLPTGEYAVSVLVSATEGHARYVFHVVVVR